MARNKRLKYDPNISHKKNPLAYNSFMRNYYIRNKAKWNARNIVGTRLKRGKIKLNEQCFDCAAKTKLHVHLDKVYPTKHDDIIKAIEEGKIFYLCKKCSDLRRKRKGVAGRKE